MNPLVIAQLVITGISALEPVVAELISQLEGSGADTSAHQNMLAKLGEAKAAAQVVVGS